MGFGEAMVTDWQSAGLLKASVFKQVVVTVEQGLVLRAMGRLSAADAQALRQVAVSCIG